MSRQFLLAQAIGEVLSRRDGFGIAYLPLGVDRADAFAIVHTADRLRPHEGDIPYALAVSSTDTDGAPEGVRCITPNELLAFRRDDSDCLAVVVGRRLELASITTSFSEVLSQSFPGEATSIVPDALLAKIAEALLVRIAQLPAGGGSTPTFATEEPLQRLTAVLDQLRRLYMEAPQVGGDPWQARWFSHASVGADRLRDVIDWYASSDPERPLATVLAENTFAAFGLPRPTNGISLKANSPAVGREIIVAVDQWWDSQDRVARSIGYLFSSAGEPHPIALINWDGLDDQRAIVDDPFRAWSLTASADVDAVRHLASLTENQFFAPTGEQKPAQIRLLDLDGKALTANGEAGGPSLIRWDPNHNSTVPFVGIVARLGDPSPEVVAASRVRLTSSVRHSSWSGSLSFGEDASLHAAGVLRLGGARDSESMRQPHILTLDVPSNDPLGLHVPPTTAATAYVLPSVPEGVLAFPLDKRGQVGRGVSFGVVEPGDEDLVIIDLDKQAPKYRVVAWGPDGEPVTLDGRRMTDHPTIAGLKFIDYTPEGAGTLLAGAYAFRCGRPPWNVGLHPLSSRQSGTRSRLPMSSGARTWYRCEALTRHGWSATMRMQWSPPGSAMWPFPRQTRRRSTSLNSLGASSSRRP